MSKTGLCLQNLALSLHGTPLIALNATVAPGEVLTVMGPSGSGKSSLLSAIIGALPKGFNMQGRILLDGQDVTDLPTNRRRIGILFQDAILFDHLSVADNLGFGLNPLVQPRAKRRETIMNALDRAGLADFAHRDPATLSGGQKTRVALLRTLLADPKALLLDEPFSRLDATLRAQIRSYVLDEARRLGLPVVLVTHDAEDASAAAGALVTLTPPVQS